MDESFAVNRLVSAEENLEDEEAFGASGHKSLRPQKLSEFIGQKRVCESLEIAVTAARNRNDSLDHVLLYGPPGLGKTTFAGVIARERGVQMKATSGPVLERPGDLAAVLSSLEHHDVLFIDEIHRLPRVVEEILYPAMEDCSIDIIIGQGPAARSVKLELKPFTLVAATTRIGLLTAPLRDRFRIVERLEYYTTKQLIDVVERSARLLGLEIDEGGASEIARRSRGTPRIANRLLRRARDYAELKGDGIVTKHFADGALGLLNIDSEGLDQMDRALLETVISKYSGGPVGVETIAASLSEEKDALEDVYEPYLMQKGFLKRTPRGRVATALAYEYLGLEVGGVKVEATQGSLGFGKEDGG